MNTISFEKKFVTAALAFIITGIFALILDMPLLGLAPLAAVLILPLYHVVVHRTHWLFFALIATLPLSTECNITPALGIDFPDEVLMMLLTGLFLLKYIYTPSILPVYFKRDPLALLIAVHLLWILVSIVFSSNPLLSLKFFLAKIWYLVPFVVLPTILLITKRRIRLFALLLVIAMGFVVVQTLVRHAIEGFSFEGIKQTLSPFFRNHVNYSAMLVCLLPVAVCMFSLSKGNKKVRTILMAVLLLFIAALVFAYSRGAWLALIAALFAWLFIRFNAIGKVMITAALIVAAGALLLLKNNYYLHLAPDYNTTVFHEDISDHLEATVQFKDVSNAERFYRWIAGVNMVAERPLTGFGPNTFYPVYKQFTETPYKTWVSKNQDHSTVHNYFLLTATEQGLPGLLIFCWLYVTLIIRSQRLYHALHDRFYRCAALTTGIVLVMICVLIFFSDLVETDKIGSFFWLCAGLMIVLDEKTKKEQFGSK